MKHEFEQGKIIAYCNKILSSKDGLQSYLIDVVATRTDSLYRCASVGIWSIAINRIDDIGRSQACQIVFAVHLYYVYRYKVMILAATVQSYPSQIRV